MSRATIEKLRDQDLKAAHYISLRCLYTMNDLYNFFINLIKRR